jgi:hypothetical protein
MKLRAIALLAAVLWTGSSAWATTVTGTMRDVQGNLLSGGGDYATFQLMNFGSNVPRVIGTNIVVNKLPSMVTSAQLQAGVTIQANDTITPATTFYRVTVFHSSQFFRSFDHRITGASYNLDSATPITTAPVVAAPTGDATYLRTDAGNTNLASPHVFTFGGLMLGAPLGLTTGGTNANITGAVNRCVHTNAAGTAFELMGADCGTSGGSGITSLNGLTGNAQTFSIGATGTAPAWLSAGADHALDIPLAAAASVTAGLVSKTQYDSFVKNNQTNTYSTGNQDFGSATALKVPTSAGAAPVANGVIAFDSTSYELKWGRSGVTQIAEATNNKGQVGGYASLGAFSKLSPVSQVQEVIASTDLTDFASKSGSGTAALGATISSPADNQCVTYDLASTSWVNETCPGQAPISVTTPLVLEYGYALSMKNQGTTVTVLHGNANGNPGFGAVLVADVTAVLKTRQFGFMVGADTGAALADTDDQADIYVNRLGQGITISEVWCACDAGSPTIQLQKDDGSPTNMLSSNLTCSAGAGASTTSFVSGENAMADGTRLDFLMVTAGGTAKRVTCFAKYTPD